MIGQILAWQVRKGVFNDKINNPKIRQNAVMVNMGKTLLMVIWALPP
jgi:hypothetical protein